MAHCRLIGVGYASRCRIGTDSQSIHSDVLIKLAAVQIPRLQPLIAQHRNCKKRARDELIVTNVTNTASLSASPRNQPVPTQFLFQDPLNGSGPGTLTPLATLPETSVPMTWPQTIQPHPPASTSSPELNLHHYHISGLQFPNLNVGDGGLLGFGPESLQPGPGLVGGWSSLGNVTRSARRQGLLQY